MWRQDQRSPAVPDRDERVPESSPGGWIHPGCRLVKEHYHRISNNRNRDAQLPLVPSARCHNNETKFYRFILFIYFLYFLNTIFVSSHMYPENPEGTQVIVGSINLGYISDTARNRTYNMFRPKREPIPCRPQWRCKKYKFNIYAIPEVPNSCIFAIDIYVVTLSYVQILFRPNDSWIIVNESLSYESIPPFQFELYTAASTEQLPDS